MFSKEEIRILNDIISPLVFEDEDKKKLQTKLGLVIEQLDVTDKVQSELAKIQEKIISLDKTEDIEEKAEVDTEVE